MTRYRVLERLGAGTGGTVYRALDLELKREVAVKVMPPSSLASAELRARWAREVRLLSNLSHPNIVRVYEPLEIEGAPAYSMEIVPGRSLAELVLEDGPQPLEHAIDMVRQAADALAYLHELKLCHRDVKPANMMLQDDGRVRVMDFGLARDLQGTVLTAEGVGLGTPRYMPPEAMTGGAASFPGDVYALALVLHELLNGRPAFDFPRLDLMVDAVLVGPQPTLAHLPEVPKWLLGLQARAIDRQASARPTMAEYRKLLARKPSSGRVPTPSLSAPGAARVVTPRVERLQVQPPGSPGLGRAPAGSPGLAGSGSGAPSSASERHRAARRLAPWLALAIGALGAAYTVASRKVELHPPPPLVSTHPQLPRALALALSAPPPPGATLRVRGAGPERNVPLSAALVLSDLPPDAALDLTVLAQDGSTVIESRSVRTPALAPVSNLACLPTDRDALVDFDAPASADLTVEVRRARDGAAAGERHLAPGSGVFHSVFDGLERDTDYLLSARTPDGWPGLAPYPFRTRGAQHASAIKGLSEEVKDEPGVEEYAASLMVMWPDTRSIASLRRMLGLHRKRTASALRSIARAVETLRDRELAQDLGRCLAEPQLDQVKAAILRAIAIARHPRAAALARPFITDKEFAVAEGAALCLATSGLPEDCDLIARAAERYPAWQNFVPPMVRSHRAQARTWFRTWLALSTDHDVMQRSGAQGLALLHEEADVALLRARLVEPVHAEWEKAALREDLARALGTIGTVEGAPVEAAARALEDAARAQPADPRPIWALARIRRPASLPAFVAALGSGDPRLRVGGVLGLARLDDRGHLASLYGLLEDAAPDVADAAAWALARLGDRAAAAPLLRRARSPADTRGVAVWALARLGSTEAIALRPELERLAAAAGPEPPPRLLSLALAAVELRWPVDALLDRLLAAPGLSAPFRDAVKAARARRAGAASFELYPLVPWDPTGRIVYPGDVLSFAASGAWRLGAGPFVRVNVTQKTGPDCPGLALSATAGDWKARLGNGPAPLLPPVAAELVFTPFDSDAMTGCAGLLTPCEGAVTIAPK